jgi:hypothetical protein
MGIEQRKTSIKTLSLLHKLHKNKGTVKMRIQLVSIGKFTEEISSFIKENTRDILITQVNDEYPELEELIEADLFIVLSSQPCVEFCKKVENYSYSINAKFLPIIVNQPMITIGPLSNVEDGACFHCFIDRVMQHSPIAAVQNSVSKYYNDHIISLSTGYHPADVTMIGNWLIYTIEHNVNILEGKIINFNMYSRYGYKSEIVGVHGCERCGTQDELNRSYKSLEMIFSNEDQKELIK